MVHRRAWRLCLSLQIALASRYANAQGNSIGAMLGVLRDRRKSHLAGPLGCMIFFIRVAVLWD
jgi:hypothetical protein